LEQTLEHHAKQPQFVAIIQDFL